jgi:enterochelin esterase-like enzyme
MAGLAAMALSGAAFARPAEIETHRVASEFQNGRHEIRVLLPDDYRKDTAHRVLYVLPVEARGGRKFGDGLGVLKQMNAHNRHQLIIVQMEIEKEPWFGDHATDPKIRQASYVKAFVVPFIEKRYVPPNEHRPANRLLFGFSKSGWGAFSLILTYPEFFGYAAAWDAPLLFKTFRFGMGSVYGTALQLERYRPDLLIPRQKRFFQDKPRLVLTGEKLWGKMLNTLDGRSHTVETHKLLERERLKHHYDNRQRFGHRWSRSWMEPTLSALLKLTQSTSRAVSQPPK